MKKSVLLLLFSIVVIGCRDDDNAVSVSPSVEVVHDTPLPIPDGVNNIPVPVETALEVTAQGQITHPEKFHLVLELNHTWAGDLILQLVAPGGDAVTILKRPGAEVANSFGSPANFSQGNFLSFNSGAESTVQTAGLATDAVIPTGTYLPSGNNASTPTTVQMSDLGDFLSGRSVHGNWKLRLSDNGGGDAGSLVSWKISLDEGALN